MRDVDGDDWRGLNDGKPYHKNLTVPASEFIKALKNRDIPPAQRTEPNMEWLEKRTKAIYKLAEKFPVFTSEHQIDCLAMVDMEQNRDDIPFNWSSKAIDDMFPDNAEDEADVGNNGRGEPEMQDNDEEVEEEKENDNEAEEESESEESQAKKILISQVKAGHTWMFSSDDNSPFWVGKIVKLTTEGARVQYYVPDPKKNKKNQHVDSPDSLDYHLSAVRYTPTNYNGKNIDKYDIVRWDEGFVVRVALTAKKALNQQNSAAYRGWAKKAILRIQQGNPGDEGSDDEK
jgi:hypothetical protein